LLAQWRRSFTSTATSTIKIGKCIHFSFKASAPDTGRCAAGCAIESAAKQRAPPTAVAGSGYARFRCEVSDRMAPRVRAVAFGTHVEIVLVLNRPRHGIPPSRICCVLLRPRAARSCAWFSQICGVRYGAALP
jgi:hypothetical protein